MIKRPGAILALLTGLNFLNYLDRYVVAAVLLEVKGDLGLSNFTAGLLATVFLLGYFVSAPVFGAIADRRPRKGLITFGVALWSIATVLSGLAGHAHSVALLFVSRALVGVGEASYATLAPTIIDDITPAAKKGRALAIFYLATPVGSAMGYLLGGFILAHWGWEAAFYVAGAPGLLLALLCLAIEEPPRVLSATRVKLRELLATLWRIRLYRRIVLGYCAHTAAVGAFSFWAPSFLAMRYGLSLPTGSFWFGLVTVGAGAVGTIAGGVLLDRAQRRLDDEEADPGRRERRAIGEMIRLCGLGLLIAAPFTAALFLSPSPILFFVLAFFAEVGVFLSTSPVNAATLRAVPPGLRASAMATSIFAIHMFGDLWSPPLLGLLVDHLPLVAAMMFLPVTFALGAWIWQPRRRELEEIS
ncbi:MAG: MFS transporter [Kofleriaceae bacterium]